MSNGKEQLVAPPPVPVQECLLDPRWDFLWINLDGHKVRVLRLNLPNGLRFDSVISENSANLMAKFLGNPALKEEPQA